MYTSAHDPRTAYHICTTPPTCTTPKLQLRHCNVLPSALCGLLEAVVHFQDLDPLGIVLVLQQLEHLPEARLLRGIPLASTECKYNGLQRLKLTTKATGLPTPGKQETQVATLVFVIVLLGFLVMNTWREMRTMTRKLPSTGGCHMVPAPSPNICQCL